MFASSVSPKQIGGPKGAKAKAAASVAPPAGRVPYSEAIVFMLGGGCYWEYQNLLDAAADLGASRVEVFRTIVLPLIFPGIIAGSLLVFIPAVGEFVIPALLGGPEQVMIGKEGLLYYIT